MKHKKIKHKTGLKVTKRRLGQILVDGGFITHKDLSQALAKQKKTGEMLGEILIRMGAVKPSDLSVILPMQRDMASLEGVVRLAGSNLTELGNILLATGHLTKAELKKALQKQKTTKKDIGEILVEDGHVKPHHISYARTLQHRIITAILAAIISLTVLTTQQISKTSASNLGPPNGAISVNARILGRAMMRVVSQTNELVVTEADISRGYVNAPLASIIDIRTNSRKGYILTFRMAGLTQNLFGAVEVNGIGEDVRISGEGGWSAKVTQPYPGKGPETLQISYRFLLSKGAEAGTYEWPLTITAKPIL